MPKRNCFSVAEKADIIHKSKEFPGSKTDFAKSMGIAYSTLQSILKQEATVELNSEKLGILAKKRKTLKASPFDELERILFKWFNEARAAKIPINGSILREKALEISSRLAISGFTASNGWIDRFKKRHNLSYKFICGESATIDNETVEEWKGRTLSSLVSGYSKRDIFNADETGLFFNLFPDRTYTVKGEKCHGGKLSKVRLTVLLCTNSDGTEKLTPFVIGKSKKPRCFKNIKSLPTDYNANKNSWMTQNLFEDYLRKLDKKMRLQRRKIILFVDQCTAHVNLNLKNVRVEFFPPNCTSLLQPCDLRIIRSFKMHYRKQLVKKALLSVDSGELQDALKSGFSICDNDNEVQPEEIDIEDCTGEDEFNVDINVDDEYIDCDKDVITTTDIPSISDLISSDESDDDNDYSEDREDILSPAEANRSIKILECFLTRHENREQNLRKLACIENSICEIAFKKKKQSKITDFFK